ncbi:MAG: hypothetical protein EON47_19145, partial [Acetobacteraceae bacterium]
MAWKQFDFAPIADILQQVKAPLAGLWRGRHDDSARLDVTKDAATSQDLGKGEDTVLVKGAAEQVRLTFTSAEVGNGNPLDSNT